jgi:translation initiation factor eIF-2B subunit epsilon
MRDLHEKHLMTGDFVVIHGDVVTNYPIEKAIKVHKARRLKDKNAIMTMVLRQIGISQRTKSAPNSPIFVIDPTTDRCLGYDEITPRPRGKSGSAARESSQFLELDANLLDEFPELDICNDLYDCGIDVCTPEVLGLWADSFDYQTPRTQLLCGVLKDYELNGKTIHTHVIKDNYAARAHNVKAYDAVSKDIISRWTYPFCPDMNLGEDPSRYAFKRRQVYLAQDVNVSRLAVVSRDSVIGPKTAVGDETAISDSVIGKNCRIGKNVVLENAYLWDGVVVGDNTEIKHAIVANGAVIGAGCHLEPGCLVSYGVKISDGITVPAGLRITKAVRDPAVPTDTKLVGPEGEGYEYVPEDDVEETEDPSTASLSELSRSRMLLMPGED